MICCGLTSHRKAEIKRYKVCIVQKEHYCKRFEPRSLFISSWSLIVQVSVILNRTVLDTDWGFDNLCNSHLESQSEVMVLNSGY